MFRNGPGPNGRPLSLILLDNIFVAMIKLLTEYVYTQKGLVRKPAWGSRSVLHIGCGNDKLDGAVGLDRLSLPAVDMIHDLDLLPWPFKDETFDVIFAHSVVEHVGDLVAFFEESWRVLRPGGRIIMTVPYFRCVDAFTDPTHTHFFTGNSLDYFIKANNPLANYSYSRNKFVCRGFWYGWPANSANPLVRLFKSFIRNHRRLYDQFISLLLPMKILVWELEK